MLFQRSHASISATRLQMSGAVLTSAPSATREPSRCTTRQRRAPWERSSDGIFSWGGWANPKKDHMMAMVLGEYLGGKMWGILRLFFISNDGGKPAGNMEKGCVIRFWGCPIFNQTHLYPKCGLRWTSLHLFGSASPAYNQ